LFDLELYKPSEPALVATKRVKLSPDGKTMEIASDAEGNPEPTVQVLELVDAAASTGQSGQRMCSEQAKRSAGAEILSKVHSK
jgi:hypothetical protein